MAAAMKCHVSMAAMRGFYDAAECREEPGELQRALLVLHGVSAFAALIVFGSLVPLPMRSGWLCRRNIASGACVASLMAVLIVTALLLYYGGEDTRGGQVDPYRRWPARHRGLPVHVVLGLRTRRLPVTNLPHS